MDHMLPRLAAVVLKPLAALKEGFNAVPFPAGLVDHTHAHALCAPHGRDLQGPRHSLFTLIAPLIAVGGLQAAWQWHKPVCTQASGHP
jgi:hypothetical protein